MIKLFVVLALCSFALAHERVIKQRISGASGYYSNEVHGAHDAPLENALEDEDIFDINIRHPDLQLVNGDIYDNPRGRNSIIDTALFWPNFSIPIVFGQLLPLIAVSAIEDARQEYEMRTCFTFPDRTDETDYLIYQPRSGCWSSVGTMGGAQTISIGSGCEKMSTVQHEMMHALGIYHEQSRTDRDGYIIIETQNIDPDLVYNFDKYGYDIVDDRRVPYDYNSVMHYGETAFSNNGEKTIVTRDPAFQNVIGQRRTFSEGDATMINRMYNCADPRRISSTCNFEEESACGYVQDTSDDIDFVRFIIGETDGKAISPNIPLFESTFGESGSGSFMLLDTSKKMAAQRAFMTSMRLRSNNPKQCLEFSYYMDLEAGSDAALAIYLGNIDQTDGDVLSSDALVTITGDHGVFWNTERFTIEAPDAYKLIVAAKTSAYQDDVIAIDDISVLDKPCDTAYFVINNFTSLLANTQKGDGIYGPLLYTDDGYAFKILFYPHGTASSADGYVGMYFALAQGENDDNLQWPFYNRAIRMMVVDQGPDALTRMSQYSNYLTSSSGGSWDKPTSSVSGAYGYSSFMKLDDILNTRNFLKNDGIVISINVRDMTSYAREHAQAFAQTSFANPILKHSRGRESDVNVEINFNHPGDKPADEPNTVSSALVGGVAFACSVGVFILMSLAIMCMSQSHKQALSAVASLKNQYEGKAHFSNFTYDGEKAEKSV